MSCERLCTSQRQPCPSPWRCSPTFCHFQDGENERARDKAARHFWASNPGYEHTLIEPQEPDQPDQEWMSWKGFLVGCALVLVAFAVAYGATK